MAGVISFFLFVGQILPRTGFLVAFSEGDMSPVRRAQQLLNFTRIYALFPYIFLMCEGDVYEESYTSFRQKKVTINYVTKDIERISQVKAIFQHHRLTLKKTSPERV
jgi:hypothetical protein